MRPEHLHALARETAEKLCEFRRTHEPGCGWCVQSTNAIAAALQQVAAHTPVKRLREDARLRQPNWDNYGSAPISDAALDAAELLTHRWDAVACNDGGVQLELHTHGIDIEIAFDPDGKHATINGTFTNAHYTEATIERAKAEQREADAQIAEHLIADYVNSETLTAAYAGFEKAKREIAVAIRSCGLAALQETP